MAIQGSSMLAAAARLNYNLSGWLSLSSAQKILEKGSKKARKRLGKGLAEAAHTRAGRFGASLAAEKGALSLADWLRRARSRE